MITFIDEKYGQGYDVTENYTFYFDDRQSIGIYYQKRLFFLSDKPQINVSVPENEIFFLYDTSKLVEHCELKDIKVYNLVLNGEPVDTTDMYLFCLNIGCKSNTVGEFTEEINIDNIKYNISADFWTQQEELEILLHNQGIDIPKDIERAFYDTNVHNTTYDWIILNRKYKELLLNIMDISYKKGSYGSLLSSLDWFEWGDILKLYEFWSTPKISTLHRHELTSMYSDILDDLISMYRKTTFIAISLPINRPKENSTGNIVYSVDNKREKIIPLIEDIELKWAKEDIMLKLTLLGNYFSTYFMPIHLDLLYSSIENIIFDAIKCKSVFTNVGTCTKVDDCCGDVLILNLNEEYYIKDLYINKSANVKFLKDIPTGNLDDIKNIYIGRGVVIPINIVVRNIKPELVSINTYTKLIINIDDQSAIFPITIDKYNNEINMNLFVEGTGKKNINVNIVSTSGTIKSASKIISIIDPKYFEFKTVKLVRMNYDELKNNITKHNYLSFPDSISSRDDKREQYNLPDCCFNNISACFLDSEDTKFYLCRDWKGDETDKYDEYDINKIEEFEHDIELEGWMFFKKPVDASQRKGTMLYIVKINDKSDVSFTIRPTNEQEDNRKLYKINKDRSSIYFNERRFISCLWKEENNNLIAKKEDAIFKCIPDNDLFKNNDRNVYWVITNKTTGEIGKIDSLINPIFWCNNVINSNFNKRGIYDIVFIKDNIKTVHVHEFRVL